MIFLSLFTRMRSSIQWRVQHHASGLYLYTAFPIAVAFLITFTSARVLNRLIPDLYIPWPVGAHVHHFMYGFFVLALSGYLALIFSGPRAKYYIALLHGFGLGLAFDEYGIWLNLSADDPARWSYDGFLIIGAIIMLIISARPGIRFIKSLF